MWLQIDISKDVWDEKAQSHKQMDTVLDYVVIKKIIHLGEILLAFVQARFFCIFSKHLKGLVFFRGKTDLVTWT